MPRQITDARFNLAEHANNTWRARLEKGTTLEDLRTPEFYRLLSAKVRAGDLIHCAWEDGSGFVILYVRAIASGALVVHPVAGGLFRDQDDEEVAPLPSPGIDEQDGVRVEWAGDQDLWRVVRVADGTIIKSGLGEQREARRQRTVYLQTARRTAA